MARRGGSSPLAVTDCILCPLEEGGGKGGGVSNQAAKVTGQDPPVV